MVVVLVVAMVGVSVAVVRAAAVVTRIRNAMLQVRNKLSFESCVREASDPGPQAAGFILTSIVLSWSLVIPQALC